MRAIRPQKVGAGDEGTVICGRAGADLITMAMTTTVSLLVATSAAETASFVGSAPHPHQDAPTCLRTASIRVRSSRAGASAASLGCGTTAITAAADADARRLRSLARWVPFHRLRPMRHE